ncbi:MAG: hypothetical protein JSW47_12065 [Phycisphaerales bacterium]|nr:MAG: hypothetical protein JSW47_12065 [Phycisphaerales bacterium]
MKPKILITFALTCLLLGPQLVCANSCPYCNRAYGPAGPGDEARVNALRIAHESSCQARYRNETPDGTAVLQNMTSVSLAYTEACRKLAELNRVIQELSGWPRAVYESLSPEERTSIEKALAALTERYLWAVAQREALEAKVSRMQSALTDLQLQLAEKGLDVARIEAAVNEVQASEYELRQQLEATNTELSAAGSALDLLRRIATQKADAATRARRHFWDTVGDLFKKEDLGSPREYLAPIQAGPVTTLRRRKIVKENTTVSISEPTLTMPVVGGVRSHFTSPLLRPPSVLATPTTPLEPTGANLKLRINHVLEQSRQCSLLNQRVQTLLIESDRAKWQLAQSITRQNQLEQQDTALKAGVEQSGKRLAFAKWELGVRSGRAKSYIMDSYEDWQQEQRWGVLEKLFEKMLRDQDLASKIHNELVFAHDIIQGDLSSVPRVLAAGDPRESEKLAAQVEAHFDDFAKSTYDIEEDPLTEALAWIKGLVDIMKGE